MIYRVNYGSTGIYYGVASCTADHLDIVIPNTTGCETWLVMGWHLNYILDDG